MSIKHKQQGKDATATKTFATESGSYSAFIPQQSGQTLHAARRDLLL